MYAVDRDALLCDMAETYHVYDLKALPVETLAALSSGLRADSRIKKKMCGFKYMPHDMLIAVLADRIAMLDHKLFGGEELPLFISDWLYPRTEEAEAQGFASGEEFLRAWNGE